MRINDTHVNVLSSSPNSAAPVCTAQSSGCVAAAVTRYSVHDGDGMLTVNSLALSRMSSVNDLAWNVGAGILMGCRMLCDRSIDRYRDVDTDRGAQCIRIRIHIACSFIGRWVVKWISGSL